MGKRLIYRDISKPVNIEKISDELRLALGNIFVSVLEMNGNTRIALNTPTKADITTATQIVKAHDPQVLTGGQQSFNQIKELVLGSVGKNITELTNAERWALLAGLLYQARGVAPDMTVRHPKTWIIRQDTDDE